MKEFVTVNISFTLADKIKSRMEGTDFTSVSDYVNYVMKEVLSKMDKKEHKEEFSEQDEEKVKKRLKDLGYL